MLHLQERDCSSAGDAEKLEIRFPSREEHLRMIEFGCVQSLVSRELHVQGTVGHRPCRCDRECALTNGRLEHHPPTNLPRQ